MPSRFDYERLTIANRKPAGRLTIEELASLPAYDGFEAQHDTCYDGSVVLLASECGVLDRGRLVIEILGPFWDRVFRIEFSAVDRVVLSRPGLLRGMDVKSIEIKTGEAGSMVCIIHRLSFDNFIEVECDSVCVSRFLLAKPLER